MFNSSTTSPQSFFFDVPWQNHLVLTLEAFLNATVKIYKVLFFVRDRWIGLTGALITVIVYKNE